MVQQNTEQGDALPARGCAKNMMTHPKHIEVEEAGGGGRYFEVRVREGQLVSGREAVDLVEPHAGEEVGHGGVRADDERTFRNIWRGEGARRLSEQVWHTAHVRQWAHCWGESSWGRRDQRVSGRPICRSRTVGRSLNGCTCSETCCGRPGRGQNRRRSEPLIFD